MKYYNEYDSIAAAIEIGYRGYLRNKEINEWASINDKCSSFLSTRWKEMVRDNNWTFRDLYNSFKEKEMLNSYRFLFNPGGRSSLRLSSARSKIDLYII